MKQNNRNTLGNKEDIQQQQRKKKVKQLGQLLSFAFDLFYRSISNNGFFSRFSGECFFGLQNVIYNNCDINNMFHSIREPIALSV